MERLPPRDEAEKSRVETCAVVLSYVVVGVVVEDAIA
jgi:hypothetical protein